MCKTNVKTNIHYVNMCKHEHEKNMTKLWCKIMHKTNVEYTKGIERSTFIYTHLETKLKIASNGAFMYASSREAS